MPVFRFYLSAVEQLKQLMAYADQNRQVENKVRVLAFFHRTLG